MYIAIISTMAIMQYYIMVSHFCYGCNKHTFGVDAKTSYLSSSLQFQVIQINQNDGWIVTFWNKTPRQRNVK